MSYRPSHEFVWAALYTLTVLVATAAMGINALTEPPVRVYAMTDSFDSPAFAFTAEEPKN